MELVEQPRSILNRKVQGKEGPSKLWLRLGSGTIKPFFPSVNHTQPHTQNRTKAAASYFHCFIQYRSIGS
jgi:hypothetical protein